MLDIVVQISSVHKLGVSTNFRSWYRCLAQSILCVTLWDMSSHSSLPPSRPVRQSLHRIHSFVGSQHDVLAPLFPIENICSSIGYLVRT